MGSISEAIRLSFPLAMAIAASPAAIVAILILLMTKRAMSNACAFLTGWFLGLFLVGVIFLHLPALYDSGGEPSVVSGWLRISLGVVIFTAGLFMLRKLLKKEDRQKTPEWAHKVDSLGFLNAMWIGFFFAAPNIKNASMVSTGAASIGSVSLGASQELGILILFCLLASIGVLLPPVIFLLFREKAEPVFQKMKEWLIRYSTLILFAICTGFGFVFLLQGVRILNAL